MKRFILKTSLTAFPALLLLISVNYIGDAAKIFHDTYELEMAEIINSGNYVTNISNYDHRIFQKHLISNVKRRPDVLIIGSSRAMLINSEYFENQHVLNNSVSGASIEDLVAIYQLYKSKGMFPNKIVIGIDPWTFNENSGQNRWQSLKYEYNRFFSSSHLINSSLATNYDKYLELLSLSYFQNSLKNIPQIIKAKEKPQSTMEKYNATYTKLLDGSLVYGNAVRNATNLEVEEKARKYTQGEIYGIENFYSLSPKIIDIFKKFITELKEKEIEIAFFLTPYHPTVYRVIKDDYSMVVKAEDFIIKYSQTNHIKLYGSFNPEKLGLDASYFCDGMHCKEAAIKKIMNAGERSIP